MPNILVYMALCREVDGEDAVVSLRLYVDVLPPRSRRHLYPDLF